MSIKKIVICKGIIFATLLFPLIFLLLFMKVNEKTFNDEFLWLDFSRWFFDVLFWLIMFGYALCKFPEKYIKQENVGFLKIVIISNAMYWFAVFFCSWALVSS